jgi:hypothetical protein
LACHCLSVARPTIFAPRFCARSAAGILFQGFAINFDGLLNPRRPVFLLTECFERNGKIRVRQSPLEWALRPRKESEAAAIGSDGFDQRPVIFGLRPLLQKFVRPIEQRLGFVRDNGGHNACARGFTVQLAWDLPVEFRQSQAEQPAAGKNRCADDKKREDPADPGQPKGLDALISNISEKIAHGVSHLLVLAMLAASPI